ncbi:hypothetical protein QJS66_12975 [Kocuria rhizophila]|nr:hypothetical protein QJS66_12975 [Kocuria rhizophila]
MVAVHARGPRAGDHGAGQVLNGLVPELFVEPEYSAAFQSLVARLLVSEVPTGWRDERRPLRAAGSCWPSRATSATPALSAGSSASPRPRRSGPVDLRTVRAGHGPPRPARRPPRHGPVRALRRPRGHGGRDCRRRRSRRGSAAHAVRRRRARAAPRLRPGDQQAPTVRGRGGGAAPPGAAHRGSGRETSSLRCAFAAPDPSHAARAPARPRDGWSWRGIPERSSALVATAPSHVTGDRDPRP